MKRIVYTLSLLSLVLSGPALVAAGPPAMAPAVALPAAPQPAVAAPALPAWLAGTAPPAQPAAAPPGFLRPQSLVDCSASCQGVRCAGGGRCGYNPDFGGCGCVYI